MSFLYSGGSDDEKYGGPVYSIDTFIETPSAYKQSGLEYDPEDFFKFNLDTAASYNAIASAATQDVVIGMPPFASKQPALTRLETHHALPTPNLLAPRANGTVTAHRFEVDDSESEDEDDCDAQMDKNDIHSNGEPLPPSPPMSSEATSPCSSRDFDHDTSESSSEKGDDTRSQGEGGEAQNGQTNADGKVHGEGGTQENHVDEGGDVDAVGETDDEADEEDSAADAHTAGQRIEKTSASEFGNANDASVIAGAPLRLTLPQAAGENYTAEVVATLPPRLILKLPARGRIAQTPSPIAGTSHSMVVDRHEDLEGPDSEYELSDDEDEYAPDVKRVRTNSGKVAGKKASKGNRPAPATVTEEVEFNPHAPQWEKRADKYACLFPECKGRVKTVGAFGRHWKGHFEKQSCPAGCGTMFGSQNYTVKRHLEGDGKREPACTASYTERLKGLETVLALMRKNPGGAKKSAKSPKTGKPSKRRRA